LQDPRWCSSATALPRPLLEPDEAAIAALFADLLGTDGGHRAAAAFACFDQHLPQSPHHYLASLGTRAAARRQGHARAVVEAGLADATARGVPAFLESSDPANHGFYARLGFSVAGTFAVPGGGPQMTTMQLPLRR